MKKQTLGELIKYRVTERLKTRTQRVARRRGLSSSDVAREGLMNFLEEEEKRLGIGATK